MWLGHYTVMNAVMMTNAQFFFGVSVPLVGILVNVALIILMNSRITQLENATTSRFTQLESTMNTRINQLDNSVGARITQLDARVHQGQDALIGKVGEFDNRLARLEERLAR
jgi:hypothetical protein